MESETQSRLFRHRPTVNVSDIPNHLETFMNHNEPGFFNPNNGQWFPSMQENSNLANDGKLLKHLEWKYTSAQTSVADRSHPVTGTMEQYCL